MQKIGIDPRHLVPSSCLNPFMNLPHRADGTWPTLLPVSKPGDYLKLRGGTCCVERIGLHDAASRERLAIDANPGGYSRSGLGPFRNRYGGFLSLSAVRAVFQFFIEQYADTLMPSVVVPKTSILEA
jgi:hypothetical protein